MKILVTGGAGFIGSHIVDGFAEAGHEVVVLDNLSTGKMEHVNPAARFVKMDLTDPALVGFMADERFEVVDHHAAQAQVRNSVADPQGDARVNILGSINLLEAAVHSGVRKVIYISSGGAIYGEAVQLPVTEDHPIKPLSPYGVSKFTVEKYLYLYHHIYGLRFTTLRYPNVYGPRQDPRGEAGVVAIFAARMLLGAPVTINGTGEQVRDYLHVTDCVAANLLVLEAGDGEAYNLGWGYGVSVNDLFSQLREHTDYRRQPAYGPPKPGETFKIFLDASKARQELGWAPTVSLQAGLAATTAYFQTQVGEQPRSATHFFGWHGR